jgi:ankyrin repeat protein
MLGLSKRRARIRASAGSLPGRLLLIVLALLSIGSLAHAGAGPIEDMGIADYAPPQGTIHRAACNGDLAAIQRILKRSPGKVNAADPKTKVTPLQFAALHGQNKAVALLIRHGAKIQANHPTCGTALDLAVWDEDLATIQTLIRAGANVNLTNKNVGAPLHLAAQSGRLNIVQLLVIHGANVNAKDSGGGTPLIGAGSEPVVLFLLAHGAKVNAADKGGSTALVWAVIGDNYPVAEILLKHGANPNPRSLALIARARRKRDDRMVDLLTRYGAKR